MELEKLLNTHYDGERAREEITNRYFYRTMEAAKSKDADIMEAALKQDIQEFEEALVGNIDELPGNERETAFLYYHRFQMEVDRLKLMKKFTEDLEKRIEELSVEEK